MARQMQMGGRPNPFIEYFKDDKIVMELQLDNADRFSKTVYQTCAPCASLLALPCFWPTLVIYGCMMTACGMPCDYYLNGEKRLNEIGDAHKLVLRERSIHYVVETHMQAAICQPICCTTFGTTIDRFEEVYPLSMVTWSGVVPAVEVCGGSGPDTFVVKVNDSAYPSVAIDAPANGKEFSDELERYQSVMSAGSGGDFPTTVFQDFERYMQAASTLVRCRFVCYAGRF